MRLSTEALHLPSLLMPGQLCPPMTLTATTGQELRELHRVRLSATALHLPPLLKHRRLRQLLANQFRTNHVCEQFRNCAGGDLDLDMLNWHAPKSGHPSLLFSLFVGIRVCPLATTLYLDSTCEQQVAPELRCGHSTP